MNNDLDFKIKKMGRPTKFNDSMPVIFENCLKLGLKMDEICDFMGLSTETLYRWLEKYPSMKDAYQRGRVADAEVVKALYDRATGYRYTTKKVVEKPEGVETTTTEHHIPPDVSAQKFILENRHPSKWKSKKHVEVSRRLEDVLLDAQDAEIIEDDED